MYTLIVRPRRALVGMLIMLIVLIVLAGTVGCATASHRAATPLPTGTAQSLSLSTGQTVYHPYQPFGITLLNASSGTYYALDGHSDCTIVELQMLVGADWQTIMPCSSASPPRALAISAHLAEPFTFAPGNARDNPNAWATGTYRVLLSVATKPDGTGGALVVYSAGFRVVPG